MTPGDVSTMFVASGTEVEEDTAAEDGVHDAHEGIKQVKQI